MSSLFAALNVSVAGLGAQSQAIGNISDDLSNSQTTGFKSIGTRFASLVTASSATDNSPGGVRATPQYQNDVQGTIAPTSTNTNLAISGQGFFAVETASQTATGATVFNPGQLYTRQGDFTLDKNGFLVNGSGFYLLGYGLDAVGNPITSSLAPFSISALTNSPVPTAKVTYNANLPSNAVTGFTSSSSSINVFDAQGATHQMNLSWTKTGTNAWSASIDVVNGLGVGTDYTATVPVVFNSSPNSGTIASITTGAGYTVVPGATDAGVSFSLSFPGAGTQTVELSLGTYNSAAGTTQFSDPNGNVSVSSFQQDGLPQGSFSSIGINSTGLVSINFTNGSTRPIRQIPLASVPSPDNLQRVSGGAYAATLAAGTVNLFTPGTNGTGTLSSSSLESSNVDIATEFTDLIQAQQIYAANAKTVTTVNNMLTTIINAVQ